MGKDIICEYNSRKHIYQLIRGTYFEIFSLYSVQLPEVASWNERELHQCVGTWNTSGLERSTQPATLWEKEVTLQGVTLDGVGADGSYAQGRIANHTHCWNVLKHSGGEKHSRRAYGHIHVYEGVAIRKILTVKNGAELRELGNSEPTWLRLVQGLTSFNLLPYMVIAGQLVTSGWGRELYELSCEFRGQGVTLCFSYPVLSRHLLWLTSQLGRTHYIPLSTGALNSCLRRVTISDAVTLTSWRWALYCSKHVEDYNVIYYYRINKLCIKLVIETRKTSNKCLKMQQN